MNPRKDSPTQTVETTVPLPNEGEAAIDASPIETLDPAQARTVGEFLHAVRLKDPERYYRILKLYPVNSNIVRDEKSHELLTDFADSGEDEDGSPTQSDSVTMQVGRLTHRQWLEQQFA